MGFRDLMERGCRISGSSVETIAVTATQVVAKPPSPVGLGQAVGAPSEEPQVGRWPGWARLLILVGGSAALWGVIGWAAFRFLKLG
jgi:hypothetical protein